MIRVFTNGCFDIIHSGHVYALRAAREMGDELTVGINTDDSVRRLKGAGRPFVSLADRIAVLRELRMVDHVIPFDTDTPQRLVEVLRPNIIVKGSDWKGKPVAGEDVAKLELVPVLPGFSTTEMVRNIISLYKSGILNEDGTTNRGHHDTTRI